MIKVCGHYVLVKPDPVQRESAGGIIMNTESEAKKESRARVIGTIVQIGEYAWSDDPKPWVNLGDKTMYSKYGGTYIEDPETKEEYVVLNDIDIVAVITAGDA